MMLTGSRRCAKSRPLTLVPEIAIGFGIRIKKSPPPE
jgi:hypothetical protein